MPPRLSILSFLLVLIAACAEAPAASPPLTSPEGAAATPQATQTGPAASPSPALSPTPLPGAALTPQPGASVDLAEARRLEAEGDLQAAQQAYVAVIAANPGLPGEATLGAARVLLDLERPQDVRVLLEPFVAGASGQDVAARYLLARAYAALGMWAQSVEQYDAYLQAGRPAAVYAYLDRIRGLLETGQTAAAIASAQSGLALNPPASLRRSFLLSLAQSNERAGNLPEAMRWYNTLIGESSLAGDDALALSRIAAIKRQQADPSYVQDLRRLLSEYPATSQALADLNDALARGDAIEPTVRGLVYYRNFDYTKADAAFREQISAAPDSPASAEAYYYLAAIQESRSETDAALTGYARAAALNAGGGLADDALWWQARILEDKDRLDEAGVALARIVSEYPGSSWAPEAAFRRGMLLYARERYRDAATLWAAGISSVTATEERQRLVFWQAKALLGAKDKDAARPLLEQLARDNEDDYFGVRAQGLLQDRHDIPESARESRIDLAPNFDWAAAEAWLSQRTGRPIVEGAWTSDPRWLRAQELWLVGRSSQGDGEVFDLIEANAQDPVAMYTMARSLQRLGRTGMSGRAGQRLLRTLNTNPNAGLPKALLSLSYPAAFGSIAQKYAGAERISPLLLLAFVRQESFFDPRAESPAGALGLTQVLPETGRAIAGRLGVAGFDVDSLLTADTSLRFGAYYMAQQLKDFGNEIFVALAAYNGGPNSANRWRKSSGNDADEFLEAIEFRETRAYVELVAENYAIYRYLYAGQPYPDLPE